MISSRNVTSIESMVIFLWITRAPQSFFQAENHFIQTWTIHMKFIEVLKCLLKLGKRNIKPRDPPCSDEHEKLK
jgi:hypothetical protein